MQATGNIKDELKGQLTSDYKAADITDFEKMMLSYADKITREAYTIDKNYIDELKRNGFDDQTLHDIVQAAAYFNYVNRLADALGVELEGA